MELSQRLTAIASMVTRGNVVCDIGCDHGYIPIYLVEQQICPRALAMDINKGPLERAAEHIREHSLLPYIETRLSDGLSRLELGEADTVVIAGMGGPLMCRILAQGMDRIQTVREFVLEPQSDLREFRRFLLQQGFSIADEMLIFEEGKYYPVIRAVWQQGELIKYSEAELTYGKILLERRDSVFLDFLNHELKVKQQILQNLRQSGKQNDSTENRMQQVQLEIEMLSEILTKS